VRRALLLLLVVLSAFVPTACGSSEGGSGVDDAVAQAAEKTVGAGSARFTITGEGAESLSGEGQFARDRGRLSMTYDAARGDGPAQIEIIYVNGKMYASEDGLGDAAGLLEGKKWLQVDLDSADLTDLADLASIYSGNPTRILEDLQASADFEEVGREEVRGAETTRYHGTVEGQPTDVWVGDDDLLRRVQIIDESTDSETTTVTIELYDFGAEVDVEAPPADEVATLDELFQGGS
jgi:predicted small secreted protein